MCGRHVVHYEALVGAVVAACVVLLAVPVRAREEVLPSYVLWPGHQAEVAGWFAPVCPGCWELAVEADFNLKVDVPILADVLGWWL